MRGGEIVSNTPDFDEDERQKLLDANPWKDNIEHWRARAEKAEAELAALRQWNEKRGAEVSAELDVIEARVEAAERDRALVVRYLRAMAKGLEQDAKDSMAKTIADGRDAEGAIRARSGWRMQSLVLFAAAFDIEQGHHLDPDRLRELGVTE